MSDNPFAKDDIADNLRAIQESIAAKEALRPKVDANGRPIGPVLEQRYDKYGALLTDPPA